MNMASNRDNVVCLFNWEARPRDLEHCVLEFAVDNLAWNEQNLDQSLLEPTPILATSRMRYVRTSETVEQQKMARWHEWLCGIIAVVGWTCRSKLYRLGGLKHVVEGSRQHALWGGR